MASVPVPKAAARTGRPSMLRGIDTYRVAFTGSGAEYFRVWVVNIVLSVVTLSLYTPWARRRTAQYFYGHTQIAGSPLEFVAELRRMVFGFLVYFGFYAAYELAVYTEQDLATTLLAAAFAVLAPFVWASAMRFRYRATRWRLGRRITNLESLLATQNAASNPTPPLATSTQLEAASISDIPRA